MLQKVKYWIDNARWIALPQSLLPALVALTMAWNYSSNSILENNVLGESPFSWGLGILAVLGVALLHLGMNLFDDYFDYCHKGVDYRGEIASRGVRARIAKCYYLQKEGGKSSINDLLKACLCFCGLALVVGIVIFIYRGSFILYLSLLTAAIGLSYSGAPFRLSYHGLGELTIGFIFGPLLMTGVYYSACGAWSWSELFISIPVGLLVSNILYTHSILDFEPDRAAGKRTLAVLLMNKKAMLFFSFIFNFFPFLIVGFGILYGFLSPWYSLLFVTFYMACALFYRMCWFVKDPQKIFLPKPWMGPVQQWDKIKEAGIEWFMVRWLLSRNYVTFFCLILILLNIFI